MMRPAYLDCAATTPVDPEVAATVAGFMLEDFGNPSSWHHIHGTVAASAVQSAKETIGRAVGVAPQGVVFVSGATEANNLAILGLAKYGLRSGRTHILSTPVEHPSVLEPLQRLQDMGYTVELSPVDQYGRADPEWFARRLRPETLLVSVMQVNNETGVIQPLEDISEILLGHDAFFHSDQTQGFLKFGRSSNPRVDLVSVSAHKMCGPKGVGALIIKDRALMQRHMSPLFFGGGQEQGLRPGTVPVALVCGFAKAAEMHLIHHQEWYSVAYNIYQQLSDCLKGLGATLNSHPEQNSPYILNASLPSIDAESFLIAAKNDMSISTGSACSTSKRLPSHVLNAMKLSQERIECALRFSWCHLTPQIDTETLTRIVRNLY